MQNVTESAVFILSAEDGNLACSVLEARFIIDDTVKLIDLVPDAEGNDPRIWNRSYELDEEVWRLIVKTFNVAFDTKGLEDRKITVTLFRGKWISPLPYLVHTGYELLLMLDGRKPFAIFHASYPAEDGENIFEIPFEPHVLSGRLIKHVLTEPFDKPIKRKKRVFEGMRHIYYTLPGEEWRVKANAVLWDQCKYVAWNESMERVWGSLLGYTDVQNDAWIALVKHEGTNWGGIENVYIVVNKSVLEWIIASGYRALPWAAPASEMRLMLHWPRPDLAKMHEWMEATQAAAVIRVVLKRKFLKSHRESLEDGVRYYQIPPDAITQLNASLAGPIEILAERFAPPTVSRD